MKKEKKINRMKLKANILKKKKNAIEIGWEEKLENLNMNLLTIIHQLFIHPYHTLSIPVYHYLSVSNVSVNFTIWLMTYGREADEFSTLRKISSNICNCDVIIHF